ncbi:hypothetical protein V3C99_009739 [Haemonchus contortus]
MMLLALKSGQHGGGVASPQHMVLLTLRLGQCDGAVVSSQDMVLLALRLGQYDGAGGPAGHDAACLEVRTM